MFRLPLRPSPVGFVLGLAVVALWALLWVVVLTQVLHAPPGAPRATVDSTPRWMEARGRR